MNKEDARENNTNIGGIRVAENRKTYYVWLPSGQIFQDSESSPWNYKIEANDEEIGQLRAYFNQNYSTEIGNFYRAHIPFLEYHHDPGNDAYDKTLHEVYELIYKLGDTNARNHIANMGILSSFPRETGEDM